MKKITEVYGRFIAKLVSMAFTPHLGLESMGQLLSIGLLLNIIRTLFMIKIKVGK